jgi:predicted ATPase
MITEWRLSNFKSVRRPTNLRLAPLTIFAGANSSGKSSLIQSILLISQSLTSQVIQRPLLLNGPLVRLGNFDDIRSFGGDNAISIGWTTVGNPATSAGVPQDQQLIETFCDIEFAVEPSVGTVQFSQLNPRVTSFQIGTKRPQHSGTASEIVVKRLTDLPPERREQLLSDVNQWGEQDWFNYIAVLDPATETSTFGLLTGSPIVGCYSQHFVPSGVFVRVNRAEYFTRLYTDFDVSLTVNVPAIYDPVDRSLIQAIDSELTPEEKASLGFGQANGPEAAQNILAWRLALQRANVFRSPGGPSEEATRHIREIATGYFKRSRPTHAILYAGLIGPLHAASEYLLKTFPSLLRYLGPLRDEPRPLQPLSSTAEQKSVGLRGEQSAAVFNLYRFLPITYISATAFSQSTEPTVMRGTLQDAVLDWLHYMDLAETVEVEDRGKHGHELRLTTKGVSTLHDLTHVGVGVSQVFPIILACLLADADTTLIFEQPELHLHPKVQAQLGDFFLSVALAGKQCIIETHSEYLVNRLRYRAAAMGGQVATDAAKIYFVEKEEGASQFRALAINEFGAIPEWPDGFFDQSQIEAENIIRAALSKKQSFPKSQ